MRLSQLQNSDTQQNRSKSSIFRWIFALAFSLLAACSMSGNVMTMNSFSDIPLGATTPEVIAAAGEPFAIHKREDGSIEYEYIERIKAGGRDIQERHYFFLIKDDKVASKSFKQSSPPPYGFDSYEMQTTHNEDKVPQPALAD